MLPTFIDQYRNVAINDVPRDVFQQWIIQYPERFASPRSDIGDAALRRQPNRPTWNLRFEDGMQVSYLTYHYGLDGAYGRHPLKVFEFCNLEFSAANPIEDCDIILPSSLF